MGNGIVGISIGGVMADISANDLEVVGSSPASASLNPEVSVVRLRATLSLCGLPVQSAKCTGNRMWVK